VTAPRTGPGILDTELVPVEHLTEHPENYNRGDDARMAELLTRFGQWRPAVVQQSTGRVLIGNTMLRAARDLLGWTHLNVHWRDADEDEARRILISDNRSRDLATTDERALVDLLRTLGDDLTGTLWEPPDVDALLAKLENEEPAVLLPAGPTGRDPAERTPRGAPTPAEYEEAYTSKATRFLALNYPLARYAWLVERLTVIADLEGVDDLADAVLRLVEARVGVTAPAADAPPPAPAPAAPPVFTDSTAVVLPTEASVAAAGSV
jgi:hypothetical protein